jgi:hypothetical protein
MAGAKPSRQMLLDGAQMSLVAVIAGTMGFLKERGIPIKDWVGSIGEQFEGSMADLAGERVDKVMKHLLSLEILPMGAEVISTAADGNRAEVELTGLPSGALLEKFGTTPAGLLRGFGVTKREYESYLSMYEPAARAIGLSFKHQAKDDHEVIILERKTKK